MDEISLKLVADNREAVKGIREVAQESQKLHSNQEKNQKRQIGLIADVQKELERLKEAQRNAMTVAHIEKYNKKIAEAKQSLQEYEQAGLKAEKQSESMSKTIGKWALSLGGATVALNLLKEAVLATTVGINAFNIAGAAAKQVMYNLVTGAQSLSAGLFGVIAAQKQLNALRLQEKVDLFNSTKQQILYNRHLVEAKDQTRSLTERLLSYDKAMVAHNKRIDMEIETMQKRSDAVKKMWDEAPGNEKFAMEWADLQVEMLNAEVRRYAGQKEISSMRSGLQKREWDEKLKAWHDEIEEQNRVNTEKWEQEDKYQKEISDLIRKHRQEREKFSQDAWKDMVAQEKTSGELMTKVWDLLGLEQKNLGLQQNKEIAEINKQGAKDFDEADAAERAKIIQGTKDRNEALKAGLQELLSFTQEITNRRLEDAQRNREILDTRISETQAALETEVRLYEAGYASNVAAKQKELADLKLARDKALKEEEEAIKKQRVMESIAQGVNIFTATTNILKEFTKLGPLGLALAAGAITGMFALIANAKKKATEVTQFAKGGWTGEGKERDSTGERVAGVVHEKEYVVRKGPASKFRDVLEAINRDDKKAIFRSFNRLSPQTAETTNNILVENSGPNKRLDEVNRNLRRMGAKEEVTVLGNMVIYKKGNNTRVIKRK